jgi:hypothetical protein
MIGDIESAIEKVLKERGKTGSSYNYLNVPRLVNRRDLFPNTTESVAGFGSH